MGRTSTSRPRFLLAALATLILMASPPATGAFFSPMISIRPPPTALGFIPSNYRHRPSVASTSTSTHSLSLAAMPASEQERLLLTEPAQTAFIVAEMRSFLSSALEQNDGPSGPLTRWEMSTADKITANLADTDGNVNCKEYQAAKRAMMADNVSSGRHTAIDLLCNTTSFTFNDGFTNQPGLLSALGSAICYFRDAFRTPANLAACERVGLSDYDVAHHITDMYHHRNFRGAYTKTLTPSGTGEIAARIAVGVSEEAEGTNGRSEKNNNLSEAKDGMDDDGGMDGDECVLWSPTTEGVCVHWKSDDEAWRKKRFERIQMEGTKDPRRGGSGTMR